MGIRSEVTIRKACLEDSRILRDIAVDTAYFGSSSDMFFSDREFLADLLMEYYPLYEPEHTFVAVYKGEVIGYLASTYDYNKYRRIFKSRILPKALFKMILRFKMFSFKTLRMIYFNVTAAITKQTKLNSLSIKDYPVYIHQNMKDGYRGIGIGADLVEAFLKDAKASGVKGIRFRSLRSVDNFKFFTRYGFVLSDCRRVPAWEKWYKKEPLYLMEYGRKL